LGGKERERERRKKEKKQCGLYTNKHGNVVGEEGKWNTLSRTPKGAD